MFLKLKVPVPKERLPSIKQAVEERLSKTPFVILLLERGLGLGRDAIMISLYRDYASYTKHRDTIRAIPFLATSNTDSFLIDLNDETHYRYLTLASVAKDLLKQVNQE